MSDHPPQQQPLARATSSLLQLDDECSWLEVVPGDLGNKLRDLDFHLRCGICREIIRHPSQLRPCGHTFCSECVRSHLQAQKNNRLLRDGCKCPKCKELVDSRGQDFEQCLQHNREMEAVAEAFRKLRAPLLRTLASHKSLRVAAATGGGGVSDGHHHRRASVGGDDFEEGNNRESDEDRGDNDDEEASTEAAKAGSAPRSMKKPLARRKLPVRYRSFKDRELRKLCKEHGLADTGNEGEMRSRLERFCTLWNSRCERADQTEKTIRDEFSRRERAQARAAREDARSGAVWDGEHVKKMFEHRNRSVSTLTSSSSSRAGGDTGTASSFSSGNAEFDQKWKSSFAALIERGRQQMAETKNEATQHQPRSSKDDPGQGSSIVSGTISEAKPYQRDKEPTTDSHREATSGEAEFSTRRLLALPPNPQQDGAESTEAQSTEVIAKAAATSSDFSTTASDRKRRRPQLHAPSLEDPDSDIEVLESDENRNPDCICPEDSDPVTDGSTSLPSGPSFPSLPKRRRTMSGRGDIPIKNHRDNSGSSSSSHQPWRCPRCTMINEHARTMRCEACDLVYLSREYNELMTIALKDGRFDDVAAAPSGW